MSRRRLMYKLKEHYFNPLTRMIVLVTSLSDWVIELSSLVRLLSCVGVKYCSQQLVSLCWLGSLSRGTGCCWWGPRCCWWCCCCCWCCGSREWCWRQAETDWQGGNIAVADTGSDHSHQLRPRDQWIRPHWVTLYHHH